MEKNIFIGVFSSVIIYITTRGTIPVKSTVVIITIIGLLVFSSSGGIGLEGATPMWEFQMGDGTLSSPVLGDLDGDGVLDIVVTSQDGLVYALRSNGSLLWNYDTGTILLASPALGDIDDNGARFLDDDH